MLWRGSRWILLYLPGMMIMQVGVLRKYRFVTQYIPKGFGQRPIALNGAAEHPVKPLDREAVRACAAESGRIITVEDHNIINGLGGAVCEAVSDIRNVVVHRIGIQDQFGQSAPYERLLEHNGITVEHIVGTAKEMVLCKD